MENSLPEIIDRIFHIEHGFKPIELEAEKFFRAKSAEDSKDIAIGLLEHKIYQVRALAVFILGHVASKDLSILTILRNKVSLDNSWQVQEILAKAFNQFCKDYGYENALPIIKDWLKDSNLLFPGKQILINLFREHLRFIIGHK